MKRPELFLPPQDLNKNLAMTRAALKMRDPPCTEKSPPPLLAVLYSLISGASLPQQSHGGTMVH